uniref:Uncharacterized protein n=1 Tax=Theropithecus gelada TaxID=9565 RepID=A0A8D2FS04_THEGE
MGQGNGDSRHQLLPGSLHFRGELPAKVSSQNNHHHVTQELLVLRIHMQLVTVQLTQLSKGGLEVVHVFNSISKGSQHLLAMGLDLGVSKAVKKSLGPGNQCLPAQGFTSSLFHIHLAPQASDGSLLLSSKMHHDARPESLLVTAAVSEADITGFPLKQTLWVIPSFFPFRVWTPVFS